jgi:hypothetical protein
MLAWAKWFRAFATGFIPHKAQAVIIPEIEAVVYQADVPPLMPPLRPLSASEHSAAEKYDKKPR